jgi:DNA-binding transcriptional regulator PaaX
VADDAGTRPGAEWLAVVTRATVAHFARAFTIEPVLEASVLAAPIVGVAAMHAFFQATRAMYDEIAITGQSCASSRTHLEWEGTYCLRRSHKRESTFLTAEMVIRSPDHWREADSHGSRRSRRLW